MLEPRLLFVLIASSYATDFDQRMVSKSEWTQWAEWTDCYPDGLQYRWRACYKVEGYTCIGERMQRKPCGFPGLRPPMLDGNNIRRKPANVGHQGQPQSTTYGSSKTTLYPQRTPVQPIMPALSANYEYKTEASPEAQGRKLEYRFEPSKSTGLQPTHTYQSASRRVGASSSSGGQRGLHQESFRDVLNSMFEPQLMVNTRTYIPSPKETFQLTAGPPSYKPVESYPIRPSHASAHDNLYRPFAGPRIVNLGPPGTSQYAKSDNFVQTEAHVLPNFLPKTLSHKPRDTNKVNYFVAFRALANETSPPAAPPTNDYGFSRVLRDHSLPSSKPSSMPMDYDPHSLPQSNYNVEIQDQYVQPDLKVHRGSASYGLFSYKPTETKSSYGHQQPSHQPSHQRAYGQPEPTGYGYPQASLGLYEKPNPKKPSGHGYPSHHGMVKYAKQKMTYYSIPGEWTQWTEWSNCTCSIQVRTRTCKYDSGGFYSLGCVGVSYDTKTCNSSDNGEDGLCAPAYAPAGSYGGSSSPGYPHSKGPAKMSHVSSDGYGYSKKSTQKGDTYKMGGSYGGDNHASSSYGSSNSHGSSSSYGSSYNSQGDSFEYGDSAYRGAPSKLSYQHHQMEQSYAPPRVDYSQGSAHNSMYG